jgi:hypothetical protein
MILELCSGARIENAGKIAIHEFANLEKVHAGNRALRTS